MLTKQVGDIAEYRTIAEFLKRGYSVLIPCGDRLPYDLAIDVSGKLYRIQVKSAWTKRQVHVIDIRRSQTNRKVYKISKYSENDFEFLVAWIPKYDNFYIFPSSILSLWAGQITISDHARASIYREAWNLLPSIAE